MEKIFAECLANTSEGIVEKTSVIQDDHIQILKRMTVRPRIYLLDKKEHP